MEIEITVRLDVAKDPTRTVKRGPAYLVFVGDRLLCRARTPFFTAARKLLAEGHPDDTRLVMRHEGSSMTALSSTLRRAASLTVLENERFGPVLRKFVPRDFRTPGCSDEVAGEDTV
jgi:hypothetical protein